MTKQEQEKEIKRMDGFYLAGVDMIRAMKRAAGNLAVDYPGIEDSMGEIDRAIAFIKQEWDAIHEEIKEGK